MQPGRGGCPGVIEVTVRPGVLGVVVGDRDPDLATVGWLSALRLVAGRLGLRLEVRPVSPELRSLLALVGLDDVVLDDVVLSERPASREWPDAEV